jgi:hypothetical protein
MFDFEDRSWLVSALLVVALWVMGVILPVRLIGPRMSVERHYLTEDDSPAQDEPPPLHRPGIILPVAVFLLSMGLVALSIMKRVNEPEGGSRWMWMLAAAGLAGLWALLWTMLSMRMR